MSKENKDGRARRLRISLVDDYTHKQIWVLRGRRSRLIWTASTALIVLVLAIWIIIAFTPVKTFLPGYPDAHQRRIAANNALTIDSLETVVARWEFYSENLRRVLDGTETIPIDSLLRRKAQSSELPGADELSRSDSLLRAQAEEAERFGLNAEKRKLPIEGMHFFPPVKGVISAEYQKVTHPFVEVSAPVNAVIMAIADGTVMDASWSDADKYTISIQHENDLVSVIKGAGKALVSSGTKVKAGATIGMIQSPAGSQDAQILRISLWYKGEAVNPAEFIKI
ncbi:MAG: M23 family metallopeptidase [Bacteroidales bacterium]|nr:M23 family metallopeptidase [Bacteroidales bacterium]